MPGVQMAFEKMPRENYLDNDARMDVELVTEALQQYLGCTPVAKREGAFLASMRLRRLAEAIRREEERQAQEEPVVFTSDGPVTFSVAPEIKTERYTEEELARAYQELERTIPEYVVRRLHNACIQARKNRLWDAQEKAG